MGTTITFVSDAPGAFWPASDLHPIHSVYPEFDPKRPLVQGEEWSFTFSKAGSWRFHDHLASEATGIVHVTGAEIQGCTAATSACRDKMLFDILDDYGVTAALNALADLNRTNSDFARNCHEYAHDLGLQAFHIYGKHVVLSPQTSYCNAGFYHGFMEGLVGKDFDLAQAQDFCERVERELGDIYSDAEAQCRHGIGHGAMEYVMTSSYALWNDPAGMIRPATQACLDVDGTDSELRRCAAGVFGALRDWMRSAESYAPYLDTDYLFRMCEPLQPRNIKEACYWEFAKYLVRSVKNDLAEHGIALEEIIPENDWESMGSYVARSWAVGIGRRGVNDIDPQKLLAFCRSLPLETHVSCVHGLAEGIIFAGHPDHAPFRALLLCAVTELSDEESATCYREVQLQLSMLPRSEMMRATCLLIPPSFRTGAFCTEVPDAPRLFHTLVRFAIPFQIGESLRSGNIRLPSIMLTGE